MPEIKKIKKTKSFYWQLFKSTFLISAFTVGGGFVIIPLLKAKYVDEYAWLDDQETLNMVSLAQSMPGVIAVNACIILGYRMAGILGSIVALTATVLPPLITLSLIASCYNWLNANQYVQLLLKGMQCGATALIINVGLDLLHKESKQKLVLPLLITAFTFSGNYFFDINLMYLVIIDGLIGLLFLRADKYTK